MIHFIVASFSHPPAPVPTPYKLLDGLSRREGRWPGRDPLGASPRPSMLPLAASEATASTTCRLGTTKSATCDKPLFNSSQLRLPLILLDRFEPSPLRFASFAGPPSDEVRPPLSSSVEHRPRHRAPLSPHRMSLTARAPMLFRCPSLPARPWAHGQRFFLHVARDNLCCCNE